MTWSNANGNKVAGTNVADVCHVVNPGLVVSGPNSGPRRGKVMRAIVLPQDDKLSEDCMRRLAAVNVVPSKFDWCSLGMNVIVSTATTKRDRNVNTTDGIPMIWKLEAIPMPMPIP